jgi:hypothetical protein
MKRKLYLKNASKHVLWERVLEAALSGARDCSSQCRDNDDLKINSMQLQLAYVIRTLVE